jgi:hypothetical protein
MNQSFWIIKGDCCSRNDRLKILKQSNTQANNYFMSSTLRDARKSKASSLAFLVIDDGFSCW